MPLQVSKRGQCLLDVGPGLGAMDLVKINPVGLQPAQAVLDFTDDPAARVSTLVRVAALLPGAHVHRSVELRGHNDVVPPTTRQRFADDLLRLAEGVHVGGVNEVDPSIQRSVNDLDRNIMIWLAPRAEHHCAEAERAHLHASTSQAPVVHRPSVNTPSDALVSPSAPKPLPHI